MLARVKGLTSLGVGHTRGQVLLATMLVNCCGSFSTVEVEVFEIQIVLRFQEGLFSSQSSPACL